MMKILIFFLQGQIVLVSKFVKLPLLKWRVNFNTPVADEDVAAAASCDALNVLVVDEAVLICVGAHYHGIYIANAR